MNIGPTEALVVFLIVTLPFGTSRLPRLARSIREASAELRAATGAEPVPPAEPEHAP